MSSAPPPNSYSSDSTPSDERSQTSPSSKYDNNNNNSSQSPPPQNDNNDNNNNSNSSQSPPLQNDNNDNNNNNNNNSSGNKNKTSSPPTSSPNSSNNKSPTSKDVSSPPPPRSSRNSISPPSKTHNKTVPNSRTTSDSDSSSSSGSSSNTSLIAGLMIGLFLISMLVIICIFCFKKRKRKSSENMQYYYADPPSGGKYYKNEELQNWNNDPQDHILRLNAQSGGGNSWGSPPPPPPPLMSTEMSTGNFSGPYGAPLPPPSPNVSLGFNKSTFSYDELAAATNGFSQVNLLGQGGFGYVHKGILPNGKEVAVKSLKLNSGQGEREFQAEVEIISRVHHRHLVSLVGYCIAGEQRLLVYEFVPNNTLEYHLHHGNDLPEMNWPTRLRIAIGSAKGLAYLHEDCHPRIIHRDIKSANILIDNNFEAMVADFGLAKLSSDNYTHVSTRVMGTFGYLAPEYASSGKLSEKSDVFSFGVMLLEIITGKRPVDHTMNTDDSLVDWARPLLNRAIDEGIYDELIDPRLENNLNSTEMARMIASAAACIRHSARKRPKMSQIVRALDGNVSIEDLNEGVKPGQSSIYTSAGDHDANAYNADMMKFRKLALTSTEFLSGEHGTGSSSTDSGNQRQHF